MSKPIDREELPGKWVHAHEEDTPTTMVFRPATAPLPPSRGRTGMDLKPDKKLTHTALGRGDGGDDTGGTWELVEGADGVPALHLHLEGGETQRLAIVSLAADRLVVRKPS